MAEPDASLHDALLPDDQYCEEHHLAVAATVIAADPSTTAGFEAPAVYQNLDSLVPAVSGRGGRFRGPYFLQLICWFAAAADATGVSFDPDTQLVRQDGWLLETDAADAAAFRNSSLQMASY